MNRKDWIQMYLLKKSRILTFARTWRALMKDVFLGAMQSSAKLYKSKCPDRIWWNTIGRSVCLRLFYYQRNPVCEAGSPRQTWYLSHFLHQYAFGPANLASQQILCKFITKFPPACSSLRDRKPLRLWSIRYVEFQRWEFWDSKFFELLRFIDSILSLYKSWTY